MNIRHADPLDIPAIVAMAAKFYATTHYPVSIGPFDADSTGALVTYILQTGVLLIAEDNEGNPVGMVGLVVAPWPMNNAIRYASEVAWWVDPEHRATGGGAALLRAATAACREKGCSAAQMVRLLSSPPQVAQLYERAGYHESEITHTKVL